MSNRQIATRAEIDAWMTQELQKTPDGKDCELTLSYRLREPDESGCNWSQANLRCGPPTDKEKVLPIARSILISAQKKFNLAEDPISPVIGQGGPMSEISFMRRALYIPIFQIDTNLINAKQRLDEVNRLERWAEDDVVLINMSYTAQTEALAGNDARRAKKANAQIFTIDVGEHSAELIKRVGEALFSGGPKDDNQRNDVLVVCEAMKYCATLVTNDGGSKTQPGGILGNRDKLKAISSICIMSPKDAVAFVESKIKERDDFNKKIAEMTGKAVPDWTEKD